MQAAAEQDAWELVDTTAAATPMVRRTISCKPHGKGTHSVQGRCKHKDCKKHSVYVCSTCTHTTNPTQKQFWFCNLTLVKGSKFLDKNVAKAHVAKAYKDN
jgi:hypothetical protein